MCTSVDIVIISDAYNDELRIMTENAIISLYKSENYINFITYIVESSNIDYSYINDNVHMVKPNPPFGYHKYLNLGRKEGNSEYVCLCNNDLLFKNGWASSLISEMDKDEKLLSASPISYEPHISENLLRLDMGNTYGYKSIYNIAGWAIFQKRIIYDIIGDLDETMVFWYADDDYGMVLKKYDLIHALVPTSRVDHLWSKTLFTKNEKEIKKLTTEQLNIYDTKWEHKGYHN